MTKIVEVKMLDKSCDTCPMFELGDESIFISSMDEDERPYHVYICRHQDFCKAVKKNWEKYHKEETV